jgi:DNA-binding winged helix-turn-helix (wHTH) protein/Tol biopolymer transport system component
MNVAEPQIYEFDDFRLDAGRRLLLQRGEPVPLKPKVFDTLLYLARHQGRILEKDELMRAIWPDAIVEENNLNQNVSTLRRVLGESLGENRYIVTVPGRGYRFAATVTAVPNETVGRQASEILAIEPAGEKTAEAAVGVPSQPASHSRSRWMAAGALAAAAAVLLWAAWPTPRADPVKRVVSLDLDVGNEVSQPAISPDGNTLVFLANGRLAVRRLDQTQIAPLSGTEGASSPFFSPDGQWIGYFASHKLRKVAVVGGESVGLCDAPLDHGGTWTEDGKIIAAMSASGELSSVPAAGGTPRPFSDFRAEPPEVTNHRRPVALPGGRGTLFVSGTGVATGVLRVLPPGGGPAKTLVENSDTGNYLASGFLLFSRYGTIFAAPMDLNHLELTGPASPLIEGVAHDFFRGADFDVSASGTLVYRRTPARANRAVTWLDSSGAASRALAKPGSYVGPHLSPDGKRLALTSEFKVWIYDFARETMTRLTFGSEGECCPVWSPDGDYVVFASDGLTWARWDGTGTVERLPDPHGTSSVPFSFSPDGRWLAFHRNEPKTGYDLWAAPVIRNGGTMRLNPPRPLLSQAGLQAAPAISPDGRWLAYGSDDETGRLEIYVIPFSPEGPPRLGKWQVSTDGGRGPRWAHNGGEIIFRSPDDHLMAAAVTTKGNSFQPGKARLWSTHRLADVGPQMNFDIAADGKRIVALLDAEETKSDETHLRVLLNVNEELRRQRADRREPK